MSTKLMIFLMVQYAWIAVAAAIEGNAGRSVYFIGALIISFGVLMMKAS